MLYPLEWEAADDEALCFELGTPEIAGILDERIRTIRAEHGGRTLLIGGPPCQAYSLVGRARNVGKAGYKADLGHRNFLYDEYFTVLTVLSPAAFVIENGKGMLSATVRGSAIFSQVMADLCAAGGPAACELFALSGSSAQMPGSQPRPQDSSFVPKSTAFPRRATGSSFWACGGMLSMFCRKTCYRRWSGRPI